MALSGFDNQKLLLLAGGLDRGNSFDELVLLSGTQSNCFIWRNQRKIGGSAKKRTLKQFYLLKMFKRRLPLPLIIRKKMILFYYHRLRKLGPIPEF